ncbi:glutathione S-transferase family protein [Ponticaulis profundi]|uniref:Glutathione S-transferase family protein n=1 Tax=Ponticaulis profundi TaxID=2665222 RepID=A0ABW1S4L1_9PROT
MITIHHLGISQSERIIWLCEEYAIPYEVKRYERNEHNRLAPDDYKALHPIGTAPVITDGDVTLAETAAIFDYLLGKYAPGKGHLAPDDPNFANYLFWYHYTNGSFTPAAMVRMTAAALGDALPEAAREGLSGRFTRGMDMLEKQLADNDWLAGPAFTPADIMIAFCFTTMQHFVPMDLSSFPAITAYVERVKKRESYQRAMKAAEPDFAS